MTAMDDASARERANLGRPDFDTLRKRAFNLRWATVDSDVIPLTAADPDFPAPAAAVTAIAEYLRAPHLCYGPAAGLPEFRSAVGAHYRANKSATGVSGKHVIATNSAASALALIARHLVQPGDEVVVQDPVDFLVAETARRAGATLRYWQTVDGRFTLDGLAAAVTPATRLLSVCHPHNPLGSLWDQAEVVAITNYCCERGISLLADEVWSDVVLDGAPFFSFASRENGKHAPWVVYGLSKGYGLAGLRIGAIIAPSEEEAERLCATAGFDQTIEGAATLSQIAATGALTHGASWLEEFLRHCAAQRDMAIARLSALRGVRIGHKPSATFVLFLDIRGTGLDEGEAARRIEQHARVRVVPGSPRWFGASAKGHVRISLATTRDVLDEALSRIERAWPQITHGCDRRPDSLQDP